MAKHKKLFVEGQIDKYFILSLAEKLVSKPLLEPHAIKANDLLLQEEAIYEGRSKYKAITQFGKALSDYDSHSAIGLMIDADEDYAKTVESIQNKLNELRNNKDLNLCYIPSLPPIHSGPQGYFTVVEQSTRVGIFILPNHQSPGTLEAMLI